MSENFDPEEIISQLEQKYAEAVEGLKEALQEYCFTKTPPEDIRKTKNKYCYPELVVRYNPDGPPPPINRSFGKLSAAGKYTTTITRPKLFHYYLLKQLNLLKSDYAKDIEVEVRKSTTPIPFPYVWDQSIGKSTSSIPPAELARWFPTTALSTINDEIADGDVINPKYSKPLALFAAPRVDYSLARLKHYSGTDPEDFQRFVLFTNYHRYVDEFCNWAKVSLSTSHKYESLVVPGNLRANAGADNIQEIIDSAAWSNHQMPAYHLTRKDKKGITLVNIGVGPSNAKTITDHVAVLRPECWIMVGHCGGLRQSQSLGDYVLAHAYLRAEHVLDEVMAPDIPIPPIAEVQVALQAAAAKVTGDEGEDLKKRLRTGTVATTDDRNWELRYNESARRFNQSRAIAVDMESATIAANGFRLRVPYGVLLCVSDKPLHGEIKLAGAANRFYERAINEHIRIGIQTLEKLADDGPSQLHSRKLRAFDEPPFR